MKINDFSLKFIDIMIGIVLGLGFQWWPSLTEHWQYIAFIFVYIDIIDYWIDYAPSLRKFPPKIELDLILDMAIMFSLFLYIYATQKSIVYFLTAFAILRILDIIWLIRAKYEYPNHQELVFVRTWLWFNLFETVVVGVFILVAMISPVAPMALMILTALLWIIMRIGASMRYKKVHFA